MGDWTKESHIDKFTDGDTIPFSFDIRDRKLGANKTNVNLATSATSTPKTPFADASSSRHLSSVTVLPQKLLHNRHRTRSISTTKDCMVIQMVIPKPNNQHLFQFS
jgi:hypothetical protein